MSLDELTLKIKIPELFEEEKNLDILKPKIINHLQSSIKIDKTNLVTMRILNKPEDMYLKYGITELDVYNYIYNNFQYNKEEIEDYIVNLDVGFEKGLLIPDYINQELNNNLNEIIQCVEKYGKLSIKEDLQIDVTEICNINVDYNSDYCYKLLKLSEIIEDINSDGTVEDFFRQEIIINNTPSKESIEKLNTNFVNSLLLPKVFYNLDRFKNYTDEKVNTLECSDSKLWDYLFKVSATPVTLYQDNKYLKDLTQLLNTNILKNLDKLENNDLLQPKIDFEDLFKFLLSRCPKGLSDINYEFSNGYLILKGLVILNEFDLEGNNCIQNVQEKDGKTLVDLHFLLDTYNNLPTTYSFG